MLWINETPFSVAPLGWQLEPPQDVLCIIVKATFDVRNAEPARIAAAQEPTTGDTFADGPGSSCVYPTDFVPLKPNADLLLVGQAQPQKETSRCDVSFRVGSVESTLRVFGDRLWVDGKAGTITKPAPFTRMPLGYDRAFGGPGYVANPIGKGAGDDEIAGRPLPNIENPNDPVESPEARPAPAGFGPLASTWALRARKLGTYDTRWVKERWPWFPADFDPSHFNAAPPALQLGGHLTGDEEIVCTNLHPEHARYKTRLPGLRVRAFVHDKADAFREVRLLLDTLWLDMDREQLVLVWRGHVPVSAEFYPEMEHVYVVSEALEGRRASPDEHRLRFDVLRADKAAVEVPAPPPPAPAEPPPVANDNEPPPVRVPDEAMDEVVAMLEKAGTPPEIVARVKAGEDPLKLFGEMVKPMPEAEKRRIEAMQRELDEEMRKQWEKDGLDPAMLEDEPVVEPEPAPRWTRERVQACLGQGESLAGVDLGDLDLSELDFSGADLSGTLFTRADLSRARLREAKLGGAVLSGCKLDGAVFFRAELADADLHGVEGTGTDFEECSLERADLTGARLPGAKLGKVRAAGATFLEAELDKCRFDGADLSGARLARAGLAGASFRGATLRQAVLEGARADGVDLSEANIEELRASEGTSLAGAKLTRARGDGSMWMGANLAGADLALGSFVRADFRGADLSQAKLVGCNLKDTDMCFTRLRKAQCARANFQASRLEGADLAGADLRDAVLYEAELWRANLADARLEGAHLAATKLTSDRGAV